jgi:hypothetical protein
MTSMELLVDNISNFCMCWKDVNCVDNVTYTFAFVISNGDN